MGLLSSSIPPYSCPVLISAIYIILSIFNPYGLSSFNQCNLYNSLTIFNPYGCSYNHILPLLVWRQIKDYLFIYFVLMQGTVLARVKAYFQGFFEHSVESLIGKREVEVANGERWLDAENFTENILQSTNFLLVSNTGWQEVHDNGTRYHAASKIFR